MIRLVALRGEEAPDGADVVIRGGARGMAPETLERTARRCFDEFGFYGVSVFVAIETSVEELCRSVDAIRRYGHVRLSTVGRLHRDGFALIATGSRPHFDIVLPDVAPATLARLTSCFGEPQPNPGKR